MGKREIFRIGIQISNNKLQNTLINKLKNTMINIYILKKIVKWIKFLNRFCCFENVYFGIHFNDSKRYIVTKYIGIRYFGLIGINLNKYEKQSL